VVKKKYTDFSDEFVSFISGDYHEIIAKSTQKQLIGFLKRNLGVGIKLIRLEMWAQIGELLVPV
jgi:hypothetical protein